MSELRPNGGMSLGPEYVDSALEEAGRGRLDTLISQRNGLIDLQTERFFSRVTVFNALPSGHTSAELSDIFAEGQEAMVLIMDKASGVALRRFLPDKDIPTYTELIGLHYVDYGTLRRRKLMGSQALGVTLDYHLIRSAPVAAAQYGGVDGLQAREFKKLAGYAPGSLGAATKPADPWRSPVAHALEVALSGQRLAEALQGGHWNQVANQRHFSETNGTRIADMAASPHVRTAIHLVLPAQAAGK